MSGEGGNEKQCVRCELGKTWAPLLRRHDQEPVHTSDTAADPEHHEA